MAQDVWDVLHEDLFCLQVVEAQQSQVVVNPEQYSSVVLRDFAFLAHYLNVFDQGNVDLLCQVDPLEKIVVLLLFIEVVVDGVLVKNAIFNQHEGLDVLQIDVFFQSAGQEKEVL